jgi:hypothetical protein
MPKPPAEPHQPAETSHVDRLLAGLRDRVKDELSPVLRERLVQQSAERLGPVDDAERRKPVAPRRRLRAAWVFAVPTAALIGVGILAGSWLLHQDHPPRPERAAVVVSPGPSTTRSAKIAAASPIRRSRPNHRRTPAPLDFAVPSNLILTLPYSNGSIATGTGTTIPVFISQNELMALGFPIRPTTDDRRLMANLILGDDGLPRAISVSLPAEMLREAK